MECVNSSMKIDSDIEMVIENIESRGVIVDKLLYQHLMKIDNRLKNPNKKGECSAQDLYVQLSTASDLEGANKPKPCMPKPAPPLTRHISAGHSKECPKCNSSMIRRWLSLKCIHPDCGHSE
ncbi:hypothetical protein NVP1214O_69 [Vibrio phage 1.214.O._10N.222.54.F11]|nr:hypothetical protein NVP1214O_69 [Vibrio phage 1.214.O._10N.222.54.F11]